MTDPSIPTTPLSLHKKNNPLRWMILLLLSLALAGIGYYFWQKNNASTGMTITKNSKNLPSDKNKKSVPTSVTVSPSVRQDITLWQEIPATVTPLQQVIIRPIQAGQIRELYFQDGQMVKKGQILAKLDDRIILTSLKQAQAIYAQTQAQLATAKQTQARFESLLAQNAVSRQEVEKAKTDTSVLIAQQASAQSQIQSAQVQIDNTVIKAPFAGQVGIHKVSVGAQVTPTDANGIVTLTQTQPIAISFGVPSVLSNRQSPKGLPVQIWSFDSHSQLIGNSRVSVTDAQIDSSTGSLPVQALWANSNQQLSAGQSVKVKLVTQQFNQVVTVPIQAVQKGLDGDFVLIAVTTPNDAFSDKANGNTNNNVTNNKTGNTTAKMQLIKVLGQTDTLAIIEGLDVGVNVVIDGTTKVRDGSAITISAVNPASTATAMTATAAKTTTPAQASSANLDSSASAGQP